MSYSQTKGNFGQLSVAGTDVTAAIAEVATLNGLTASATELNYTDITTLGTVQASKCVTADANKDVTGFRNITADELDTATATALELGKSTATSVSLGAADIDTINLGTFTLKDAHSGLLMGCGASGSAYALGSTADNAVEYFLDATHTTGDMRGEYARLYFSGAGGSGECKRIFSTINNVSVATGGTVNGAHISIGTAGASAAVSGAANALRATFGIAAASTNVGGTCSVIQVDTDFDNAVTVPTNFAFLSFTNTNTKKSNALLRVPAPVGEANGLFCAHTTDAMTHSLRFIDAAGTEYHIMCTTTATNRTEA